ncbi:MAG: hypothetical protein M3461_14175 [Pseudomonadota bacterium]|nr:hypothetical protein [Pseudomonadota bacterium]
MMGLPKHVFSGQRIGAWSCTFLHGSWPRIVEQAYWTMVIWGLVARFFLTNSSWQRPSD